jgi:hypothetical protein
MYLDIVRLLIHCKPERKKMRLPKSFASKLPENWFFAWLLTEDCTFKGKPAKVALCFDVFRVILAVEQNRTVKQYSVDYDVIDKADWLKTAKDFTQSVLDRGCHSSDKTNRNTTLEEIGDEEMIPLEQTAKGV